MPDADPRRSGLGGHLSDYPIGPRMLGDQKLYRAIAGQAPTLSDFESNAARGREPIGPEQAFLATETDIYRGVSMFATAEQAAEIARRQRRRFIARVFVPAMLASTEVTIRRSGRRAGHHSVWGDAGVMLLLADEILDIEGL